MVIMAMALSVTLVNLEVDYFIKTPRDIWNVCFVCRFELIAWNISDHEFALSFLLNLGSAVWDADRDFK